MSEFGPSPAPDEREVLYQGVKRHEGEEIYDDEGHDLREQAERFAMRDSFQKENANDMVADARRYSEERDTYSDIYHAKRESGAPQAEVDSYQDKMIEANEDVLRRRELEYDSEIKRKANLWDASQHLQRNVEGYKAAAVEDANAAGHDIDYNGEHYPAK